MTSAMRTTEGRNLATMNLDELSPAELLQVMNQEDRRVADAVAECLPELTAIVEVAIERLRRGGRLIYLGAGTSGRLGVLDAAECRPTFSAPAGQVVGLLAGGPEAMFAAVEGAEDSPGLGVADLKEVGVGPEDVVIGIAASGRTPYVLGALDYARTMGAATASIACNWDAEVSRHADIAVELCNGPEALTGSTRLKAGTSQKLALNMISTATMVGLGKAYQNLMVDLLPTNDKLRRRAVRIVCEATGCDASSASAALEASGGNAKTAIVMVLLDVDADVARRRLEAARGFVRAAIAD